MKGVDLDGVFRIRTIDDGKAVKEWAENCKSAIVTGAGLIGIEIAYAFKEMGINVTLTEMMPQIVPRSLDPDMAKIIETYLEKEGINIALGHPITELKGENGKVTGAVFGDGTEVECDIVLKATAKNPKNRYNSSKEMHDDLLTCLNEERTNEPRIGFKYPEHELEIAKGDLVVDESSIKKNEPK